jgi:signal transduction histidine kinase
LLRFRLSSVALALTIILTLAGLYAIDRTLSESSHTQVQIEVAESGALVEGFLAAHAEALQAIRGLYLDTARTVKGEDFHALVTSMLEYAGSFRRLWITDSTGRLIEQYRIDSTASLFPPGLDIDTATALSLDTLAQRVRRTRRTLVSSPGPLIGSDWGIVILEPMFFGDRFLGFAGGTISSEAILESVQRRRPRVQGRLIIFAGADTVVATGLELPIRPVVRRASATFHTPGGGSWRIEITRTSNYGSVRVLLWGVGLVTLAALIVVFVHERRQRERLAERSVELERLSTELLRANRAKSEFLANVSHELRTPLNAIVGFVELLRDGVYGDLGARQVAPVDRIASSANHLRQLVDQILDLAKMAAGRLEVHLETVDLRPFVLNVASEVEALVNERGLNFSIAVGNSLPRVRTDPMHLRQILMNLLGNAIKFTPSGGIAIRARLVTGRSTPYVSRIPAERGTTPPGTSSAESQVWVALQVADSGIGIAQEDRERIFEEFEQVNAGPRSDSIQRGTGLGLPISRRLARLLGGDLTVESELGKGSTFTVWLPVDTDVSALSWTPTPSNSAATAPPVSHPS